MSGFGAWLCRKGLHTWGITTWPIGVRWCERCNQRDPAEPTGMEILVKHLRGRS